MSDAHPGSHHNLGIRRAGPALQTEVCGYADSPYQGYDRDYSNLGWPYEKLEGGKLTDEEKAYNRGLTGFRGAVEHRIGRTKRFWTVAERFRLPLRTHHTKTSIVAGLVNIEAGF